MRAIPSVGLVLCLALVGCAHQGMRQIPATTDGARAFPPEARYEVGFSPNRGALDLIVRTIDSAREEILVATYSFTSKSVSAALVEAQKRGVKVQVVSDDGEATKTYSAITFLANQGVPVRVNGHYAIHHHKFIVVDRRHLQTGSFNYSAAAAEKNAENVLVIWNAPELANTYATEWRRLWGESDTLSARY